MYICCWKKKNKHVICEKITFQNGPFYFVSFFFVLPQKPNIFTPTYYIVRVLGAPGITFSKKKKNHENTFFTVLKTHQTRKLTVIGIYTCKVVSRVIQWVKYVNRLEL